MFDTAAVLIIGADRLFRLSNHSRVKIENRHPEMGRWDHRRVAALDVNHYTCLGTDWLLQTERAVG